MDEGPARIVDEIALTITTVGELTRDLLPPMTTPDHGIILNVASAAAFQPVPDVVYGATKAFVQSFTEALWGEVGGTGVKVLALCPGATETEFFAVSDAASVGRRQTPEQVVQVATREHDERSPRPSVLSGVVHAVSARLPRLVPRRTTVAITRKLVTAAS